MLPNVLQGLPLVKLLQMQTSGQGQAQPQPEPEPVVDPVGDSQVAHAPHDFRGMFGIRSTARDVLGTIGDAFLVQGGRDPLYYNRRRQERQADALQGMADDPLRAAERLTREDPTAGREMFDNVTGRNIAQDNANRLAADSERERQDGVREIAMRLLFRANEQNYPFVRQEIGRYLERNRADLGFELPEAYDEAQMNVYRYMGIEPDDQARMEDTRDYREALIGLSRDRNSISRTREGRMDREGRRRGDQRDRDLGLKEQTFRHNQQRDNERTGLMRDNGRNTGRRRRRSVNRINPDGTVVFN